MNEPKENIDLSGVRQGVSAKTTGVQVLFPEMQMVEMEYRKSKAEKIRKNKRERKRRHERKKTFKRMTAKYGREFAEHWDKRAKRIGSGSPSIRKFLRHRYPHLTKAQADRIADFNTLSKMPILNLGWTCSRCGIYSKQHAFFDLDHKHAKSKGGSNRRFNMQILCPNCHRRKTL